MTLRTTIRLLAMVCVLGAVIWVADRHIASTDARKRWKSKVFARPMETVSALQIERGALRLSCVRRGSRQWSITQPLEAQADDAGIERLLSVLEAMPRRDVITPAQRRERQLDLAAYGLDEPRLRLVLEAWGGRMELLVGRDAPLGDLLYVRLAGSEDVIATARDILTAVPETVEALRDRAVLHGDASRTARLEIRRPGAGFIQLLRRGGEWSIQQPVSVRADGVRLGRMLDALFGLKVLQFVWDPPAAGSAPEAGASGRQEAYGLGDDEAVKITVWVDGDEVGKELMLGKSLSEGAAEIYGKRRDQAAIYAVGRDILDIFSVTVNDLRDRGVFRLAPEEVRYVRFQKGDGKLVLDWRGDVGWRVTEPVAWKADEQVVREMVQKVTGLQAAAFLDQAETNLAAVGLDPPACVLELGPSLPPTGDAKPEAAPPPKADAGEAAGRAPERLLVGGLTPDGGEYHARLADGEVVFKLSAAGLQELLGTLTDPLVYRDRTMLALPPESVRRVGVQREGVDKTVMRRDDGAWATADGNTNQVDRQAVDDILLLTANLRALRVEALNPRNLAVYGLDPPGATLTLGLSGEGGIQKSVRVGYRAKTDGLYAMIQGQDLVFVLDKEAAERLLSPLVRPSPAADVAPQTPTKGTP